MKRIACCRPRKRQLSTSTSTFDLQKSAACRHLLRTLSCEILFGQCQPLMVEVDHTTIFLVDVDQTALLQPVDGQCCRRLLTCQRLSTSILQPFPSRPEKTCIVYQDKLNLFLYKFSIKQCIGQCLYIFPRSCPKLLILNNSNYFHLSNSNYTQNSFDLN